MSCTDIAPRTSTDRRHGGAEAHAAVDPTRSIAPRDKRDVPGPAGRTMPLTVYYNTRCPVCDGGVAFQKSRLVKAARAGAIAFHDINLEPEALEPYASLEDVRRRLHARDGDGTLYVGIDCVIAVWRRTPGNAWMAWLLERRVVHPLAGLCYDALAAALYAWNRRKGRW